MSYPRNAASPERVDIGAVIQISDGAVQTSGVAVKVIPQGGSEASGGGTIAYSADGIVYYLPTQAETNYTSFILVASKSGCIPASKTVVTSASATAGYAGTDQSKIANPTASVALTGTTIATTQKVDVETIKTQALTAAAGITFGVYVGGTAAAAVASTALSTAQWTNTLATDLGTTNTTVATNLNATVSSRLADASYTAPPAVGAIADAVWDEARAGHTTAGTFGFYLDAAITGVSAGSGATAQQVWEYATRTLTGAVALDSASRLAIWNTLTTETFTADSFGDLLLISDGTNGRAVKVTGANHVAADIHDCQADGLTASTEIAAVNTFAARVTTGLVLDGAVYQFTANMLELAPAGGGGGGSGDATLAKQEEILTQLDVIQTKTDQIGSVGAITSLLAAAVLEPGTITSFPETLTIGDSYTDQNGRSIQIPIVDTDGNPLSSTGSLNFADASVTFTLQRSGETDSTRVITGTASFVDPPGTGTGAGAPYAVVEISSTETAKGLKKYKYSGILTFTWAGTGTDQLSFTTGTVTFTHGY